MFENIMNFFKKFNKKENKATNNSKDAAKERLHLVLMQDRANVSADFLELMKQEIIEVIKKYIDVDESAIDVRLTNKENGDGTNGAPALYANIPILNIKNDARKIDVKKENTEKNKENETKKIKADDEKIKKENNKNIETEKNKEEKKQKAENKEKKEPKNLKDTENKSSKTKDTKLDESDKETIETIETIDNKAEEKNKTKD